MRLIELGVSSEKFLGSLLNITLSDNVLDSIYNHRNNLRRKLFPFCEGGQVSTLGMVDFDPIEN